MQTKMHSVLLQLCIILGALSQVCCQDFSRRRSNGYRNVGEASQIGSIQETEFNIDKPLGETQPLSLIPAQNVTSRKRKRIRARRPKMDAVPVHEVFSGGLVLDRRPNYNEQPPEPDIDVAMGKTNDTSDVRKMVFLNLPDIIEKQIRAKPKPLNTLYLSGNFKDLIKPPAGAFFPRNIAGSTLIGLRKITHSKIKVVNVTQSPVQKIQLQQDQQEAFPMIRSQVFKQGADNMNSPYALMDTMVEDTTKPQRRKLRRKKITTSNLPLLPITIPTVLTQTSFEELSQTLASQPSASSTEATRRRKGRRRLQGSYLNNQQQNYSTSTTGTVATTQSTRPSRRTTTAPSTIIIEKLQSTTAERESWEEDSELQSNFEPLRRSPSRHAEAKATGSNDKNLPTNTKLKSSSYSHIQHSTTIPPNSQEEPITQLVPPSVPDRRASSRILGQTKSTRTSPAPPTYLSSNNNKEKSFSTASIKLTSQPITQSLPSSFRGRKAHSRNLQRNPVTTSTISAYNSRETFSTVSSNLTEESAADPIPYPLSNLRVHSRTQSHTQTTPLTNSSPLFPSYIPRKKFSSALQQLITISTSSPILTKDNVLIDNVQHLLSTTAMPPNSELDVQAERDYTSHAFHQGHKMPIRRFRTEAISKRPSLPIATSIAKVQHLGFSTQGAQQITNAPFIRNVSRFPAVPRADLPAFTMGPTVSSARFRQRIPFNSALLPNHEIPTSTRGAQRQPINRWQQELQKNHRYHSVSSHQQNEEQVSSTFPPTPYYHEEIGQRK